MHCGKWAALWRPGQCVSLWHMFRFYADKFVGALNTLGTMEGIIKTEPGWLFGDDSNKAFFCRNIEALIAELNNLGLRVAAKKAAGLRSATEFNTAPEMFVARSLNLQKDL